MCWIERDDRHWQVGDWINWGSVGAKEVCARRENVKRHVQGPVEMQNFYIQPISAPSVVARGVTSQGAGSPHHSKHVRFRRSPAPSYGETLRSECLATARSCNLYQHNGADKRLAKVRWIPGSTSVVLVTNCRRLLFAAAFFFISF